MNTASSAIDGISSALAGRGYLVGASPLQTGLLATRRGHSFGPFLPYTDYLYIHDLSSAAAPATGFEQLHEQARAFSESQFRLPRPLRYHIPNTVSIAVSQDGLSEETVAFAQKRKLRSHLDGGEKNSTYAFDLVARKWYSQGPEATPVRYGGTIVSPVNPTNRILELMEQLAKSLFEH